MYQKQNLVYACEDHNITDYDGFSQYVFTNYRDYVWRVYDGVEYCHPNDAAFLCKEFIEFKETIGKYW